ncbi:hypothetical protein SBV1_810004 [Verrucomicrobia bacterium]|nr:hypothetical protein SBV1_810004 [Verrucomicrobiota bacterium]
MIDQKECPYCQAPSQSACRHLALAVEGRDFVHRCIELSQGQDWWRRLCTQRREQLRRSGEWSSDQEDFMWLETAFCEEFLKPLAWFGAMDHEWRTGPRPGQGGFWVLLWSKDPQRLWWELHEEFERQVLGAKGTSNGPGPAHTSTIKQHAGRGSRQAELL